MCQQTVAYGVDFGDENMINNINGIVHASGLKFDIRSWLDIGSKEWQSVDNDQKKQAFLAVKKSGWTSRALSDIMLRNYTHLSEDVLKMTFEMLES